MRLLDVGAGRGWPSPYLAQMTGCEAVITDIPETAIRSALTRATRSGLSATSTFLLACGTHLPFRSQTFDAVVHTDAL